MKNLIALLAAVIFISCQEPSEKVSQTASLIANANVVDVRAGTILENRQVVIDSGKITAVLETMENPDAYAVRIDATGKFLMPGLAEMHAHIPRPPTPKERIEDVLFLYLSNGITTIRGMLGHPAHLELREKAAEGSLASPRIFTSSPSLNGGTIPTPEEARKKVTSYKEDGYDFLKIHPGVPLDAFDELVKTANEIGIPFAGHVPVAVGIRHALESRYASIDHIDGFLEGLVPESAYVKPDENGFFGFNFTPLADTSKIYELVQLAKTNEVWIVPTQSLFTKWFAPVSTETLLTLPEMKYMSPETLADWKRRKEEYTSEASGFDTDQWQRFDSIRKLLIKKLQDGGHGMLLGSDAPQLFNVPGFSIHKEMEDMAAAGLTNLEIIQSGTLNPARYFDMEDGFGEIKEGLVADLILIDANPLENLTALREISGVMRQGDWFSKEEINKKLAKIAEAAMKE